MPRTISMRKTMTSALSVTILALGSLQGVAHASIPGADFSGRVVVTDSTALSVSVNPHLPSTNNATGQISNNTGTQFNCSVPGLDGKAWPGQVTEAQIVKDSMSYYSRNIFRESGITAPVAGTMGTGSLYNILPSQSAANSLGDDTGTLMQIRAAQSAARVAGHTGNPTVGGNTTFNVNAGATVNWTATLGAPSTGTRTDFYAAAMFFCTGAGQSYVFAGYEPGTPNLDGFGRLSWS